MLQTYQEYFKGNNIKIILKYDGERNKNKFTVVFWNKSEQRNKFSEDTDNPFITYINFFKKMNIDFDTSTTENQDIIFDEFMQFTKKIVGSLGGQVVLVFSIELSPELEFFISVTGLNTKRMKSNSINDISDFIHDIAINGIISY